MANVVHSALLLPEILNNILSHLPRNSQVLAARVCCLWWDAAIGLIWHTIDDWHNLFRIAGPLHTVSTRRGSLSASCRSVPDITRMQIYSQKVRHLMVDTRTRPLDCVAMQQHSAALGYSHVSFASLCTFTFTVTAIESLLPSLLFLGIGIHTFNLDIHLKVEPQDVDPMSVLELFWTRLRAQAPGMTSLRLSNGVDFQQPNKDPWDALLCSLISLCGELRELHLDLFPHNFVPLLLLRLPRLEKFTFTPWIEVKAGTTDDSEIGSFRTEHKLFSFSWGNITQSGGKLINTSTIRQLDIGLCLDGLNGMAKHPPFTLSSVLNSLSTGLPRLISLQIRAVSKYTVSINKLDPKTHFESLQKFGVQGGHRVLDLSLTNNDVKRLAQMFPSITDIKLSSGKAFSMPSLESLQVFARHCHKIISLELNVDATLPLDNLALDFPYFHNPVSITFLPLSKITSASTAHVAIALTALCGPNALPTLNTSCSNSADQVLWNCVRSQLSLLHQLRSVQDSRMGRHPKSNKENRLLDDLAQMH